jgi:hypothetical protein
MAKVTILSDGYHRDLQWYVDRMEHDFQKHEGTIHTTGYTDMPACCALFERIDPDVRVIHTIVEGRPDATYKKRAPERRLAHGDGWQAYWPVREAVQVRKGESLCTSTT